MDDRYRNMIEMNAFAEEIEILRPLQLASIGQVPKFKMRGKFRHVIRAYIEKDI